MWRICVDTGGTFTDALGVSPSGEHRRAKALSTGVLRARVAAVISPDRLRLEQRWGACDDLPRGWRLAVAGSVHAVRVRGLAAAASEILLDGPALDARPGSIVEIATGLEAPLVAAHLLTATPGDRPLPPIAMRLATTRGTNALLTRAVAPVALFITRGLGDLLEIGTQRRPDLFALDIRKPAPVHRAVVEVDERLAADGRPIRPPDLAALEPQARALLAAGVSCAAVALLHSDLNDDHERAVAVLLARLGFRVVRTSREVSPFVKVLPRAQTTVIEAGLAPVVSDYLDRIGAGLGAGRLDVLTSAGGLVPAPHYRAKDSLLSGPAGGVVGAAAAARSAGEPEILAFDMGGTSTDVSRWAGAIEHAAEHTVADATLVAPAVSVHTVAAGGGSICGFDGAALTVGPASAGADPGPACYGRGGPLTLTDVQLLAGRMPRTGIGVPLDPAAAQAALEPVVAAVRTAGDAAATTESVLDGLLAIAAERIAAAIRVVSTRRGHDPAAAALLAFGGAGGQLACPVASRLGMSRIIVPPDAGLLSARGLAAARYERVAQQQVLQPLSSARGRLPAMLEGLREQARAALRPALAGAGAPDAAITTRFTVAARFAGQETPVEFDVASAEDLEPAFEREYQRTYGYRPERSEVELVWLRAIAAGGGDALPPPAPAVPTAESARSDPPARPLRSDGAEHAARVAHRSRLIVGQRLPGPALVLEDHCTTVVDVGWSLEVGADGALVLSRGGRTAAPAPSTLAAAEVELFTTRVESAAIAMGEALRRTSFSVNVKERLDYSCAVLDANARLVACAPHVPVHLGSLGVCAREVLAHIEITPGDVVVTNHPACGGSHLPDVTVIAGAFDPRGRTLGYVAARAHHAEIGGIRPGSMPPGATRLAEEGVVIAPMYAVRRGESRLEQLAEVLTHGPWPTRALHANLEDVRAAIAACRRGRDELEHLAAAAGTERFSAMLEAIQSRSATIAAEIVGRWRDADLRLDDTLDDGSPLRVRITEDDGTLTFDFTGTSSVHPGNLNATPAIVNSCVLYVLRLLAGRDLPLNEGLMRPVRLVLPVGLLNPPFDAAADPALQPAVVGGNVEVSQRLVNMLLLGLGAAAESQGTMNNLIFGDQSRSYYETICGGAGAGPGFHGASAVHTHMTNTRITDPEILERRYPVRLERFALRRGSGGAGLYRGGDGVEREIRFLSPMSVSVLTQRRTRGPRGSGGGGDGQPGAQWIARADGSRLDLGPSASVEAGEGDTLVMLTPGGGGWNA